MSRYVLDTDILSLLQDGDPTVRQRVAAHPPADIATTIISVEEQLTGWYTQVRRAKRPADLARAYEKLAQRLRVFARVNVLVYTVQAIARYEQLKRLKLNIGKMDLRIAAIALEHGAILVTRNTRDFQRVSGLVLEDWSQ